MRSRLLLCAAIWLGSCLGPPDADEITGFYRLEHNGSWETLQLNEDGSYVHEWRGGASESTWSIDSFQSGCPGIRVELRDYVERVDDGGFGLPGRPVVWSACLVRNATGV